MSDPKIVLVANDVVPGMGLPVAAPGLRAYGLAEGLRHHGLRGGDRGGPRRPAVAPCPTASPPRCRRAPS